MFSRFSLAAAILLMSGLELRAAETAESLMKQAHDGRAIWSKFPGFTADISAGSDKQAAKGTLKVSATGDVILAFPNEAKTDWAGKTLKSVVGHRLSEDGAIANVDFADDVADHPLGRLLKSKDASEHSLWRVKGDLMTEVHRAMGKTRFIISVVDVARTKEGKHLPRNFTVTTWDAANGAIVSTRQVYNEWTRVGDIDLPTRLLAINSKSDGTRTVEDLVLTNHKLGNPATASAAKTTAVALAEGTPPAAAAGARQYAPLKAPVTSLGAAIVDGNLYIYGGHLGSPHEYTADKQANELMKLNLAKPEAWEVVNTGPRRTGLAMVAHGGKLYRVGGWEAKPADGGKFDLVSSPDFARFDPKVGKWEDLAPLPKGRSSHDAALLGDKLYVVGGWKLDGRGEGEWHGTAYVADLSQASPEWKEVAKPSFKRRALAVAAYQGKIYVIGGMNDSNEITRGTSIYDPATDKWSDGPEIPAPAGGQGPMEGFGASAFGGPSGLFVSTSSGKIFRLSKDGKTWDEAGALAHPRFFHRLVLDQDGSLVVVGGTSRGGKITQVEVIKIAESAPK